MKETSRNVKLDVCLKRKIGQTIIFEILRIRQKISFFSSHSSFLPHEHGLPEKRELFREQWRDFFVDFSRKPDGFYSWEYRL
ncbi:hypothetical protein MSHOH_3978 [Methanosarcina horonobensis HB-1 = JCM 15518]|uniref:Uncharacterized protein n=1 Tax=Methanosarcina horonobensis HB-1 = JCM 15518 TaxID=1434110 RepID=A0A0E3SGZ4_9EURY|nr:hypothetical protein [Methanosarcina horonobensis]AKB80461.1 hypothetical protein MSHOH_3978 [Methanosarcina horonobensis HB-1 = JCM 15518]